MVTSPPFDYEAINIANGLLTPSEVHLANNITYRYFFKYLLQKAMSVFKWSFPDNWDADFFLYALYIYGFVGVFDSKIYGVIPQNCTLQGNNVFYRPKKIVVSNPALPYVESYNIDVNCTVIKLQPDYTPPIDIVSFYAAKMALAAEAIDMNLQNSKLAYVMVAGNKTAAESLKKLFDEIMSGKPAVVIDKNLMREDGSAAWETFSAELKQNYIASELLSDLRKIEAMFATDIGIPNANTDKKERLISDEVNANNAETATRAELWLTTLKKGIEQTNKMFNLNISVDWRVNPNEQSNTVNTGVVSSAT